MPLLLVAALVAAVTIYVSVGSSTSGGLYSELLRVEALGLERKAVSFQNMIFDMAQTDRIVLERLTADIEETIVKARETLALVPYELEYLPSITLFEAALVHWENGAVGFRTGVLRVADNPSDAVAGLALTRSLTDMAAGDRNYILFVKMIGQADIPRAVGDFPEVTFLPQTFDPTDITQVILASARLEDSSLKVRVNTTISRVITDPEWALDVDGDPFVPASTEITVKVVVGNDGNATATMGDLRLRVMASGETIYDRVAQLPALPAQEQSTITFTPIPVTPGFTYQLVAELTPVAGEENVEDNTSQVLFSVNLASTTTAAP